MTAKPCDFRERLARVESLVRALEELPDTAAREAARELVRTLLGLHTAGLRRVLELVQAESRVFVEMADDQQVTSLLLLHGLHPRSAEERVSRALERARPRFHSLGGDVELVTATQEVVRLRLVGDAAAASTLRTESGEVVIEVVPDVVTLEFEEAWDRPRAGRVSLPVVVGGKP